MSAPTGSKGQGQNVSYHPEQQASCRAPHLLPPGLTFPFSWLPRIHLIKECWKDTWIMPNLQDSDQSTVLRSQRNAGSNLLLPTAGSKTQVSHFQSECPQLLELEHGKVVLLFLKCLTQLSSGFLASHIFTSYMRLYIQNGCVYVASNMPRHSQRACSVYLHTLLIHRTRATESQPVDMCQCMVC